MLSISWLYPAYILPHYTFLMARFSVVDFVISLQFSPLYGMAITPISPIVW